VEKELDSERLNISTNKSIGYAVRDHILESSAYYLKHYSETLNLEVMRDEMDEDFPFVIFIFDENAVLE
jgi:hypothetical protein